MAFKEYTIISHGMGTDSCAIMELLNTFPELVKVYIKGECFVIFSDLGVEYPETYEQIPRQKELAKKLGFKFVHLKPNMGFHPREIQKKGKEKKNPPMMKTIYEWWWKARFIAMTASKKYCTFRWKISPIWDYMSDYLDKTYFNGEVNYATNRKAAITEYGKQSGHTIRLILGFTKGEEKRIDSALKKEKEDKKKPNSYEAYIRRSFPLKDLKLTREKLIELYRSKTGFNRKPPRPSNCMYCHYQSPAELLYLYRNYPDVWKKWVALEKRKMDDDKIKGEDKSLGVKGAHPLPYYLKKAQEKYGHMSDEELYEYVLVHGCATNIM